MTISQSSSSCASGGTPGAVTPFGAASFGRLVFLALGRWQERKRAKADLARLAEVGDHLLLDVGLDPKLVREDPGAALEEITGKR